LEYTVDPAPGTYDVQLRVASAQSNQSVRLRLGDRTLGEIAVPNTGGWSAWKTITLSDIAIETDAPSVLRVEAVGSGFVFREVSCRDGRKTIDDQVRGAREAACFTVVWPELTMPPRLRTHLVGALKRTVGPGAGDLKAAVAGSWHERDGEAYVNEAVVVNGFGKRLFRYRKIIPYIDGKNIQEGIRSGTSIPVLVTDEGLVAVAICRDFCERKRPHFPGLDVDFVLVPSLGDPAALEGNEATAGDMNLRHGTRSFVVQQCLPREPDRLGWVVDTRRRRDKGVAQASTFVVYPRHETLD
jgi:hypothetical protein